MGGGLLPCMGRLDFGWRLGCEGMPERSVIRCKERPSELSASFSVDTMGFWAPHVREAVEVFGADRVMFGTDYGPVPIDPKEHVDIVNALAISDADKEKILWRNAARFFNLDVAIASAVIPGPERNEAERAASFAGSQLDCDGRPGMIEQTRLNPPSRWRS